MSVRRLVLLASLTLGCRRDPELAPDAAPLATAPAETDASSAEDADAPDTSPDTFDPLAHAIAELADATFDAPVGGEATIASVRTTTKPALPGAAESVAAARWRFRACARAASTKTRVTVAIRVGEGGEPLDATVSPKTTPEPVSACVRDAAKRITFGEPPSGSATVEVVIVLAA